MITKTLNKLEIKYIYIFDVLYGAGAKYLADEIWLGHHTPLGNKIVCNVIFKNLKLKNTF